MARTETNPVHALAFIVLMLMVALPVATLLVGSCSTGETMSPPEVDPDSIVATPVDNPQGAGDGVELDDANADSDGDIIIHSDEGIKATMACEPVSDELLEQIKPYLGTPNSSVQVEVGEGLKHGEIWWVIVLDSPPDDSRKWGLRAFLTNAPGIGDTLEEKANELWIPLNFESEDTWEYVDWDEDSLVRAQSALEVALEYMGAHPSENQQGQHSWALPGDQLLLTQW